MAFYMWPSEIPDLAVLMGKTVTTHWDDIKDLKSQFPNITVLENRRWIQSDKYFTSGGISAGIDMSLHLVSQLHSNGLASRVAQIMEYRWQQ